MRFLFSYIIFFAFLFFNINGFSQSPDLINYQAVARDLSGNPLVSTAVNITYDIRQNSAIGTVVYSETHNLTTNQFGLFTAQIGGGTPVTGTFAGINWSTGLYYLQVTVNGDVMTATQLLSVPYALHANTATSGVPGANGHANLADSLAEPAGVNCANGGYLIHMGADDNDNNILEPLERDISYYICNGLDGTANNNDTSATNEIQTLSISNDTVFLSNGGFIVLPNSGSLWNINGNGIDYTSGNVGVGTTTPNRSLSIESATATGDGISINNSSTGNPGIEFQTLGNPRFVMGIDQSDNNKFKIGTTNVAINTRLTINSFGKVGIGTPNPLHQFSVLSLDTVVASFLGANSAASIISVAGLNPSATTGAIFLTGSDSGIIAIDPIKNTFFMSNTAPNGHLTLAADSSVVSAAQFIVHSGDKMLNNFDSIFNYSSGPNGVFNVNQGTFVTDSLYVVGANPGNLGWLLSDDGFGQAVWTDPNSLGLGGGLWTQGTGDIFNTSDSVGIGVANPSALLHVSGGGLTQPIALFEKGGFLNAAININHTGSNGSGINFQNGGTTTSNITSTTSNVLSLTSDFVEVGNSPKAGIFNVAGSSSISKPTILVHESGTGFSRIKHTNSVANKYWIVDAGISALDPNSGYSISYNDGVNSVIPFIVYGDEKVGINNIAAPLGSFHVMDDSGSGMITEGFNQPGLLVVGRNNFASPNRGAVQNGDQIGKIIFPGHTGISYGDGPQIIANATENFTSTAYGSEMIFRTIANGTNTDQDVLTLLNDGTVEVPINLRVLNGAGNAGDVLTSDAAGNASWQTPSSGGTTFLIDGDGDTEINVEASPDQDVIHFSLGNSTGYTAAEYFTMIGPRLEIINSGNSVFIGQGAGVNDDLTNNLNTFVGHDAGNSTTTGVENVALGSAALFSNVSGSTNTAIGREALRMNTGSSNTAVGFRASQNNTSGVFNTAFGTEVLRNNLTSHRNSAFGNASLRFSTGANNSAFGADAGVTLTSGDNNTFIGKSADASTPNINNATAIGANAVVGQSNSLILGNNANVGIGTSTPVSSLNIIYSGTQAEASLVNYTQTSPTLNGTGFFSSANTNGIGNITGGGFLVNSSANSAKTVAVAASNIAGSLLNIGVDTRVSGTNGSATHIGGAFTVTGGASNHALQLVDGTEGDGKILVSDANGKTSWKTNRIAFEAVPAAAGQVFTSAPQFLDLSIATINIGGNYNASGSEFIAPNDGVYNLQCQITVKGQSASPNLDFTLEMLLNGNPFKSSIGQVSNTDSETVSISVTVRLAGGDKVSFRGYHNIIGGFQVATSSVQSTWFSGHLVFEN